MLLVGQRTNVQDVTEVEASSFDKITKASKRGKIFHNFQLSLSDELQEQFLNRQL
jgi:hypothetical protein